MGILLGADSFKYLCDVFEQVFLSFCVQFDTPSVCTAKKYLSNNVSALFYFPINIYSSFFI